MCFNYKVSLLTFLIGTIFSIILINYGNKKYSLEKLSKGSNCFLKGIATQNSLGWLTSTQIKKLTKIQEDNQINLGIPKYFSELIEEFS